MPMGNGVLDGTTKQHPGSVLHGRRIGFFTSIGLLGGAEFSLARIMQATHLAGAEVICWAPAEAQIRDLFSNCKTDFVQFINWPPRVAGASDAGTEGSKCSKQEGGRTLWSRTVRRASQPIRRLISFWSEARSLRREFQRLRLNLLFVSISGRGEPAALGARMAGVNRVTRHSGPPRMTRRLIDLILKIVTLWSVPLAIHVSEGNRRGWCRLCCYPRRRTRVILNGVPGPWPAINTHAKRLELGIPADTFLFCFPARLSWMKGHSYLFEAIGAGRKDFSVSQVLICGDGPEQADLQAQCDRLGLTGIVRFLGWRRDIREIIQAIDCVVLPSL